MPQFAELVAGCCGVSVRFKEIIFNAKMRLNKPTLAGSSATTRPYWKVAVNRPADHAAVEEADKFLM